MRQNVMYAKFGGKVHYCWRGRKPRGRRIDPGHFSLYYGRDLDNEIGGSVHAEYNLSKPVYALGGHLDLQRSDGPVKLAVYLWPVSLYLTIETPIATRIARKFSGDDWGWERGLALHIAPQNRPTTVRWRIWAPPMSWNRGTPRWRDGSFDLADALLGRRTSRWEPDAPVSVAIPMPEGTYPATVTMRDHVSWCTRLPFWTRRRRCADVDIPGGIGFPGKGENAWDCGDDGIFAMSCPAETVEDAIGKVVASVMRDRMKNGGAYTFTPSE